MSYPLLPIGTWVKPQVRGLNFHWLRVVEDPCPTPHHRAPEDEPHRADQRVQ
jgi:hypothetical protein